MSSPVSPDLQELLRAESAHVEWKENVADEQDVAKKLVAFANDYSGMSPGGWVVCGVREVKDEHGFARAVPVGLIATRFNEIRGRVLTICAKNVAPPLLPGVQEYEVVGDVAKRVLVFYVAPSPHAHGLYTRDSGTKYYVASGSNTIEAKGELLNELRRRKSADPPLLERPCPLASMEDLLLVAAEEFLREAKLPRPAREYLEPGVSIDATARPLVAAQPTAPGQTKAVPTLLAMLLFGREPRRFLPGAFLAFSAYPGDDRSSPHSVKSEVVGPLPKLIRDVLEKLMLHMGTDIDKSADALAIRQNRPRYSSKAVQEAVVNAFAHRDYASSEPTRITVFSDRIEIVNPGGIDNSDRMKRIQEGSSPANWRNAALARFLFRMQLAQEEGQGIPTILRETFEVSGRKPNILSDRETFTVVIPAYQPTPAPRAVIPVASAEDGLLLIAIGSESLRPTVEASLTALGLEQASIVVDFFAPDYVDSAPQYWGEQARRIRNAVKSQVDDPRLLRLHLFYRGPVVLAPLLGALVAPAKPLFVYHYQDGRYWPAWTFDRRFLIAKD